MTVKVETETADRLVVVYAPNPDTGEDMYLWAALNQWLWSTFSLAMDCDSVEIHLVYASADAARQGPSSAGESQPELPGL